MSFLKNIKNPLNWVSGDIAIDLGTANTLVYIKGKGVVINEPSIVAKSVHDDKIIAVGYDAKAMVGRTHREIETVRPLRDGVIADFNMTDGLLQGFINKINLNSVKLMWINYPNMPTGANADELILADINANGSIDIVDVVLLINTILSTL